MGQSLFHAKSKEILMLVSGFDQKMSQSENLSASQQKQGASVSHIEAKDPKQNWKKTKNIVKDIIHILKIFVVLGDISLEGFGEKNTRQQKSHMYILGILEAFSHVLLEKDTKTKHFLCCCK
jgi:hypothetical protein